MTIFIAFSVLVELNGISAEKPQASLKAVRRSEGIIALAIDISNRTSKDTWICQSNDRHQVTGYELDVFPQRHRAELRLRRFIVPDDTLLEEPLWARHVLLRKGRTSTVELTLRDPLRKTTPLGNAGDEQMKGSELDSLTIYIGYHIIDLTSLSSQWMERVSKDEVLINCFWEGNRKEKVISLNVALPRQRRGQHNDIH